jgi:co-chaperonin GroES (HSP10)
MIKRGNKNSVLVELEKLSDNEYSFASGVKLFMDTSYKPEEHQRIYGKCVAIPEVLTKGDMVKFEEGDYRFVDSIVPEVQIGDTVYFNYVSVNKQNLIEYEGKSYCNINYSAILCVVREGKIIPIGGNIMCKEYYGKGATFTEVGGVKVFGELSSSGLITSIIKKPSQRHAVVRITGTPLKGDSIEVSPGDVIMFPNKFGFKNNIEGKDYLFVKYWDVHAIVGNEKESLV